MSLHEEILEKLKSEISTSDYERYIKFLKFNEKLSKEDFIVYNTNNEIMAKFINTKFSKKIASLYEEKTNLKTTIKITSKKISVKDKVIQQIQKPKSTILCEAYNFDNFIVGDSNRFAYMCCKSVAQNPGKDYNPLFIYGPSGLGKTHLLQSIGNFSISNNKSVICVTSEQFINEFTFNLKNQSMEKFKEKYRNCDILLIDDVQFLGKTEKIQEEFFHTFNDLKSKNSHIIMTSDEPPKSLKGFEERLLSRFGSGLVADIIPPELDTKVEIIKRKSKDNKINLTKDVIEYIATNMGDNIREIESALNKLNAFASLVGAEITLEFTKSMLQDQIKEKEEKVTLDKIVNVVAKELNIKPSQIKDKTRTKAVTNARRIAIYLSKILTQNSMPTIALFFGMKDHSAVSHNIKSIKKSLETDELLKVRIEELKNKISKKGSE